MWYIGDMENHSSFAVTFGRFNLPHPGHVDLIKRMLDVAGTAYVAVSSAKSNNDIEMRIEVLDQLCYRGGLDSNRIFFFASNSPYDAVHFVTKYEDGSLPDPERVANTTVVLGIDQTKLGERLRDDLGVKFVPNEVRVGSSTVIRYFLEIGDEQIVREIYHNDDFIFADILALRQEELAREKS
jgi:cytidyltransferase-like protein